MKPTTLDQETAAHVVPYCDDHRWDHSILNIVGTYHNHAAGHVPEGEEARKEHGGPMVSGPWAYTFGLCSVLDNAPADVKETRATDRERSTIPVQTGTRLEIGGVIYRAEIYRREYIRLEKID